MSIWLQIVILLLFIVINGLLAMSEIAIVSSRKVRLKQRADTGNKAAQTALELANQPNRFLSTVQIGITMVGIVLGAFGGATIASQLAVYLRQVAAIAPYAGTISMAIVVLITTYLSLVIGELAPKQIGLNNPERVALLVARPLAFLSKITAPLVKLLSLSTTGILKLLRIGSSDESHVTEEEVRILIGQGAESGVFEPIEEEMVDKVFRMSDQRVSALITPRREIVWIDLEKPPEVNREIFLLARHSHLPVARGSLDDIQGYVRAVNLLEQCLRGQPLDFEAVLEPAVFVPETIPAFDMLERLKETGTQMAFAVDEFGGLQGLVTHQDVLEAIIGDIHEPDDEEGPDVIRRADGSFLIDGMLPVIDFKDLFDLRVLPDEDQSQYSTLGGYVMTALGRIPKVGDQLDLDSVSIEVVDLDGLRVDKLLVERKDENSRQAE